MKRAQYGVPVMKFVLAAAVLVASNVAVAEPAGFDVAKSLRSNVVRVEAHFEDHTENGFGFIVGERKGMLYIATAYHVVSDPQVGGEPSSVKVEFYDDQGKLREAELLGTHDATHDLAVLTAPSPPDLQWSKTAFGGDLNEQNDVWFVGRLQKWFVSPNPGKVSAVSADGLIEIDGLSVRPGSSGAPLIASSGIAGMVLSDSAEEAQALGIEFIKDRFHEWNHPWNLQSAPKPSMSALEEATNRQGSDFAPYGEVVKSAEDCRARCLSEEKCLAMTFVANGTTCWLKTSKPNPLPQPGMVSAVKNFAAAEK